MIRAFSGTQLDLALGRSNVIHAALLAGPASQGFLTRCQRMLRFRTGEMLRPGPDRVSGKEPKVIGIGNGIGMSETKTPGDKKIGVGKTLTLKPRTETGVVRQSFSHGRSKQVVVETVKRRTDRQAGRDQGREPVAAGSAEEARRRPLRAPQRPLPPRRRRNPASCCAR